MKCGAVTMNVTVSVASAVPLKDVFITAVNVVGASAGCSVTRHESGMVAMFSVTNERTVKISASALVVTPTIVTSSVYISMRQLVSEPLIKRTLSLSDESCCSSSAVSPESSELRTTRNGTVEAERSLPIENVCRAVQKAAKNRRRRARDAGSARALVFLFCYY